MSYRGYTQMVCENGHYSPIDCYDEEPERCPECAALWAWKNTVDITNGNYDAEWGVRIDGYVHLEPRKHKKGEVRWSKNDERYWIPGPGQGGTILPDHPYYTDPTPPEGD